MTVIPYLSVRRFIILLKRDKIFFTPSCSSFNTSVSSFCIGSPIFNVLYKILYTDFILVDFQQINNISIIKRVGYTPSRLHMRVNLSRVFLYIFSLYVYSQFLFNSFSLYTAHLLVLICFQKHTEHREHTEHRDT